MPFCQDEYQCLCDFRNVVRIDKDAELSVYYRIDRPVFVASDDRFAAGQSLQKNSVESLGFTRHRADIAQIVERAKFVVWDITGKNHSVGQSQFANQPDHTPSIRPPVHRGYTARQERHVSLPAEPVKPDRILCIVPHWRAAQPLESPVDRSEADIVSVGNEASAQARTSRGRTSSAALRLRRKKYLRRSPSASS